MKVTKELADKENLFSEFLSLSESSRILGDNYEKANLAKIVK